MLNDQEKHTLAAAGDEKRAGGRSTSPRPRTPGVDKERIASASPPSGEYDPPRSTTPFSLSGRTPTLFNLRRASRAPTIIPRSAAISRMDLIASAERIYLRYLSPAGTIGSPENHEIYLPPALRIHSFPLSSTQEPKSQSELNMLAHIPDMFHAQKEYCFRAMEQDAFPRFLRAKAFGNLTPLSALVRLVLGLLILWIGLATAFSLIFLDVQPKSKRFFVSPFLKTTLATICDFSLQLFLPFTFATLFLISHQYELDPVLVFLGQSESTPFRTLTIREPYVKKLLLGRAIWVTTLVAICVTALTLIFWAVPGHRL